MLIAHDAIIENLIYPYLSHLQMQYTGRFGSTYHLDPGCMSMASNWSCPICPWSMWQTRLGWSPPAFMQQFCHRQLLRSVPPPSSTSPLLPWCGGSRVFGMEYLCRPVASMDLWCLTWIHQDWPSNFLEFPSVVRQGQTWWWVYFRLRCSFFFAVGLVFVDLKRICTIDMSHIYVYIYTYLHM